MKKLILIVYLFIPLLFYCQENVEYEFNKINFFAPATQFSNAINKTSFTKSKTTVFFNENTISILVFYPDEIIKSKYNIEKVNDKGDYYSFVCLAENSSTVFIDIQKNGNWIKRTVKHNGIIHKFYNN